MQMKKVGEQWTNTYFVLIRKAYNDEALAVIFKGLSVLHVPNMVLNWNEGLWEPKYVLSLIYGIFINKSLTLSLNTVFIFIFFPKKAAYNFNIWYSNQDGL